MVCSLLVHTSPTRRSSDLAILSGQARDLGKTGFDLLETRRRKFEMITKIACGHRQVFEYRSGGVKLFAIPAKDRKSTRLHSSHLVISYAVFCLKNKIGNHV